MESNKIRQAFLDFFESKGHVIVPSAPMVVKGDPTLMFTNAGMNQFKDIFLGNAPRKYPRAADTQKCLRVSGKHNDLEEVGHDTYHHTMFEMLGNWSYGDYFKKEAIEWAWELLHDVYKLPAERMYATVFEGSEEDGVPFDQEAYDYWKQFLPEDHIIRGNKHDNFWEMGETGPCGPCSEIHFDLRDEAEIALKPGREMVNMSHPQVIEIWNLVFMQFNRKANGSLEELPARNVDTGMGFERLCMILQGKKSNYDTDVFQPTIGRIAAMSGKKYGEDAKADVAMRVIADHLRAIAFSIADGQLPSNVKAGYVIRRILRRAVRYGYTYLGFTEPTLCRLVPGLVEQMGGQFPELKAQQGLIEKVIEEEEASFLRTLATGINLLDGVVERTRKEGRELISGKEAFELYDTFGFPIDLTELIAREQGVGVDLAAFEKELQAQKERSRNAAAVDTDDWVELIPIKESVFTGYDTLTEKVRIARYRRVTSKGKTSYQLVFDRTPFYGNSGGQIGDIGFIESANERIPVVATEKENGLIIHIVGELPENPAAEFTGQGRSREAAGCGQQPHRHAPHARGVAQGARHARRAEGFDGDARDPALRLLAFPEGYARGAARGRKTRQPRCPRQPSARGEPRGDQGGGREMRCDDALRREIRRQGPHGALRNVGRAVRRYAHQRDGQHRLLQDPFRERHFGRRAPHRGRHGRAGREDHLRRRGYDAQRRRIPQ